MPEAARPTADDPNERKPATPFPTVRPYRPGDESAIVAAFNDVFAATGSRPPRTVAEWNWAFRANPAGMRVFVAMDGARCAAHYASQPRRTLLDGRVATFAQIVDSFVHADYRNRPAYAGLFAAVGDAMLTHTVGAGRDVIAYGWPTMHHLHVGARRLGYLVVRQDEGLSRPPGDGPDALSSDVAEVADYDERLERLYHRCAPEWGASTIRDRSYLAWRVFACPLRDYRVFATTGANGEFTGAMVCTLADWPQVRSLQLCDWLVPARDEAAGERLLDALFAIGRGHGASTVLAMFPPWSPWYERFRAHGFHAGETGYAMVSGTYNDPRYPPEWLRDRWWYQPLDLDIF